MEPYELAGVLESLANETRLRILRRLWTPGFVPDLSREFGMTRQAVQRHLEGLQAAGLVERRRARRGVAPAMEYLASPAGLFMLKEEVLGLALPPGGFLVSSGPTLAASRASPRGAGRGGPGLLLVHGDVPGRWMDLGRKDSWILGRDERADLQFAYDSFCSGRHAHLQREGTRWRVRDLHSTNGTFVNYEPLSPGDAREVAHGDLLTIGRTRLLLRERR